jgi:protein-S-isoprenylcysteine O-methyltransferase Ste14
MLFSQHWLIVIMGALGIVCMVLISRDEDQRLLEKFGDRYRAYIESVPALNVLAGLIRLLR